MSADGLFRLMFCPRFESIVARSFVDRGHDLSFEHVTFAVRDDERVGMMSAYSSRQHSGFSTKPLMRTLNLEDSASAPSYSTIPSLRPQMQLLTFSYCTSQSKTPEHAASMRVLTCMSQQLRLDTRPCLGCRSTEWSSHSDPTRLNRLSERSQAPSTFAGATLNVRPVESHGPTSRSLRTGVDECTKGRWCGSSCLLANLVGRFGTSMPLKPAHHRLEGQHDEEQHDRCDCHRR